MPAQKLKKGDSLNIALTILGTAVILAGVVLCPNLAQLIPMNQRRRYPREAFRQACIRLDKKGWIMATRTANGWKIKLTKRGQQELLAYELRKKHLKKTNIWDGRWRIVMFDIPEKNRFQRDKIRQTLLQLDFIQLQRSVWIYPYECREILNLVRTACGARQNAIYLTVDSFEQDAQLRKHFGLKS